MADMQFFMPMNPPTATAQEKQSTIKNGKRCYYSNERLQKAQDQLVDGLFPFIPDETLTGPVRLLVVWLYKATGKHTHGEWRTTKPDTDNLQKLLKDIMTNLGFWKDDAQVVYETCQKIWTEETPGILVQVESLGTNSELTRTRATSPRQVN